EGSTFWIELECADGQGQNKQKQQNTEIYRESDTTEQSDSYEVLCVEDNPTNMKLIKNLLAERNDIRMLSAGNGELGLELATSHCPDLILLDINLPGISGYEVIQQLKESKETKDITVIAISANAMPSDIDKAKTAGFNDYLTKPFDIDSFHNMIESYLPLRKTSRDS
ncbi:MAG: response regulator, partial [Gammaproteobacteria bacterium]|nr:response regulator [Gammaproteobacteria bacterium]